MVGVRPWRGLVLAEPDQGGGITEEPFLLAHQIKRLPGQLLGEAGAGVGPLSLVWAQYCPRSTIVALELQHPLTRTMAGNIQGSGLQGRVLPVTADLRCSPFGQVFDGLAMNPPFFPVGSGQCSPDPVRCLSRFEMACCPEDVVDWAKSCLKPTGWLALVLPRERGEDYRMSLKKGGLGVLGERRLVHQAGCSREGLMLLAGREDCPLRSPWVEDPLVVRNETGRLTAEGQEALH